MAGEPRDEPTGPAGGLPEPSGSTPLDSHRAPDKDPLKARVVLKNSESRVPIEVPVKPMSELERQGVELAQRVLWIIAAITLALLLLIAGSEFISAQPESETIRKLVEEAAKQYISSGSNDALNNANTLIGRLSETRRASRDFWLSIGQFLLLNLLLPVLTSILGFIFGTIKSGNRD